MMTISKSAKSLVQVLDSTQMVTISRAFSTQSQELRAGKDNLHLSLEIESSLSPMAQICRQSTNFIASINS